MSRSGYADDIWDEGNAGWLYRGAVDRALQGKRGQAFLRELIEALDAMPEKKLIADYMVSGEECCALGAVGLKRGLANLEGLEDADPGFIANRFGIARSMAAEIMYENDEGTYYTETPERRWTRMRRWAESNLRHPEPEPTEGT